MVTRATKKLGSCNDTECRYCIDGRCCFGIRDVGCYMESNAVKTFVKSFEEPTSDVGR